MSEKVSLLDAGSLKVEVDLNKFLIKYLEPEDRPTVLFGKGKCRICGGFHSERREWNYCAIRRGLRLPGGESVIYGKKEKSRWSRGEFVKYEVIITFKKEDPIIVCVFPPDKESQMKEDLRNLEKKVVKSAMERLLQRYKRYISSFLKKYGVDPSPIMKEESLDDVFFTAMVQLLRKRRDLFTVKRGGGLSMRGSLLEEFESEEEADAAASGIEFWLCNRLGLRDEEKPCWLARIKAIDREGKRLILAVPSEWLFGEILHYEVDLRNFRIREVWGNGWWSEEEENVA